ncbi:NACHT domain-containing protein [Streptomyces nanshensis]|uniref:ATP-binding protein n=1 Tax=Streptomyces nanshensis TaxID=518642 RepID=A0A1E7L4C7_9ACTN|nr:NACHT domain-containing protein [Streptomyces nanshensis]OEV11034.1 ATP-binding protein [Streptomyces nanshensis]
MEQPAVRLASTVVEPLIGRLLSSAPPQPEPRETEAEGATGARAEREAEPAPGSEPGRLIARLVSFRGEDPELSWDELVELARELVRHGLASTGPSRAVGPGDEAAVGYVLARTLHVIGELDTTDTQAVRLGPQDYARRLRSAVPGVDRTLSREAAWFHDGLLVTTCLHFLHTLIVRSPELAERLPERSHRIGQLVDLNDVEAVRGHSQPSAEDAEFEARYLGRVAEQYNRVTIYGIDLPNPNAPDEWSLDATYLSLSAEFRSPRDRASGGRETDRTDTVDAARDGDGTPADAVAGGDGTEDGTGGATPGFTPEPLVRADRALAVHERVLLRGVAGSGKTTLVQWLAVSTASGTLPSELQALQGRIPFVLPVRRFARDGIPAPDDLLSAMRHPLADQAPEGWVARVLASGRAMLLVDGIDEAPDDVWDDLRTQLRRLLRIYSGNLCLVTSRPSAIDADWLSEEGFTELTLAPMSHGQVAEFVTAWHDAARSDEGKDHARLDEYEGMLLRSIPIYRELRVLATNPLMCGLICALNRDRSGSLPQGRKELYEAAVQMLLQRRNPERRVFEDLLQRAPRERLLRKLAYRMLVDGSSVLDHATALAEIARHAGAIPTIPRDLRCEDVFNDLLLRTGLLREQADGSVEFVHRTMQDYLAAREAVDQGEFGLLLQHAHESGWEEVFRMAVAYARPAECATLLQGLLTPGWIGMDRNRRHLLAASCLEHVTELDPQTRDRVFEATQFMVRPRDPTRRKILGFLGPIVLEMLPDPATLPDDEAYLVALTVTRVRDDAAVDYLARLRDRGSLRLRTELANGWHKFATERYAEEVLRHLDPTGVYFPVSDHAELAKLKELGGRERVQITGDFRPEELLAGLERDKLTHLWIAYDLGPGMEMEWLREFPSLTTLRVHSRLRVTGVPEGIRIMA